MLFVRTYHGMLGGHLKVFEYMHHVRASGFFEPILYLTPESTQSPGEWLPQGTAIVDAPVEAQAYFIGGFNWRVLDEAGVDLRDKPVVNLLQGLRHAAPGDARREFLSRPALRICVSPAVYDGVRESGLITGEVAMIPNGIDLEYLSRVRAREKRRCVFIAGSKQPHAAQAFAAELATRGIDCDLCVDIVAREVFLSRMSSCDIVAALPDPQEGFFLPPLEAMAMGCAVVLPHCAGASSYAFDRRTCLSPALEVAALLAAIAELRADGRLLSRLRDGGMQIAAEHSLSRERAEFTAAFRRYLEASEAC